MIEQTPAGRAITRLRPDVTCFAAHDENFAAAFRRLAELVVQLPPPRPVFGFGGPVFLQRPDLRAAMPGLFLGQLVAEAVDLLDELVMGKK